MEESFARNNTSSSSSSESNSPSSSSHMHFNNSPSNGSAHKSRANQKRRPSGRKKFQETRHPVYHGVRQRNGKWVSELREPKKKTRVWVGTFACPHMAARAYDAAAFALRGESALLNFPEEAIRGVPQGGTVSNHGERENWGVDGATSIGSTSSSFISPSSSSISGVEYGNVDIEKEIRLFVDEEELFNMPGLMDSMAEGLMVTPPSIQLDGFDWDGMDDTMDLPLWSD